ncbi:TetR/AcrR family transcriptional regulator [Kocuria rosea]|uniref:TetR/AcrR family transcriptional regulator n=1 Tax=Kocuria rosea TaxID=1275 RepID=A0A4V3B321_KOCRO|nr:TetR/AcrR family transcriptional regulator [Kocuria rosea]TDL43029.1 TetR/AcrR family transcriptional regulator [Kocuria rosea]
MDSSNEQQLSLRERNKLRARADILDAAAELLSEAGYAGTTLEELSRRAGLSRGTLYAYFPEGRDQIVREVYLRIAGEVYDRGSALRAEAEGMVDRITALARALVEATSTPAGRFYGVMGSDIVPVLSGVLGVTSKSFEELIKIDLSAAQTAGQLPEDIAVGALATALTGAIRACGARAATDPDTAQQQITAIQFLVQGLLARAGL